MVLADDAKWLRDRLAANGVPAEAIAAHLAVLGNKEAMEAHALVSRARCDPRRSQFASHALHLGDADDTVGRMAARRSRTSSPRPIGSKSARRRAFPRQTSAGPRLWCCWRMSKPTGLTAATRELTG